MNWRQVLNVYLGLIAILIAALLLAVLPFIVYTIIAADDPLGHQKGIDVLFLAALAAALAAYLVWRLLRARWAKKRSGET
jgi:uncharacterized membrane protein YdjX (TVP38/TMEM64 family)